MILNARRIVGKVGEEEARILLAFEDITRKELLNGK
jgi:hypothetical protein